MRSESEDESVTLLLLRLALAFAGSLTLFVATLDLGLVSVKPPASMIVAGAALVSGGGLLLLGAGLLGSILRRRAIVVGCLAASVLLAIYGAWRLARGAAANDPWAVFAVISLGVVGVGTLAGTLWLIRRHPPEADHP